MKEYLQLTRAHTAPLETVPALGGALLATGGRVTLGVVWWGVFGLLYHLAGYGLNSVSDWKNGFDKVDPNKQHHPLNTGAISYRKADRFTYALFILTIFVGVVGAVLSMSPVFTSALIILALASGTVYNEAGKNMESKFLFICIAHSMVFALPYVALGGNSPHILVAGTSMVYVWVMYQIAISGELKDIAQDNEANLLRKLGMKIEHYDTLEYIYGYTDDDPQLNTPAYVRVISTTLRAIITLAALVLTIKLSSSLVAISLIVAIGFTSSVVGDVMLRSGDYKRDERIMLMSVIEVCSLSMFALALEGVIGALFVHGLIIVSGAWVVIFNRIEWGTIIAPEV